MTHKEMVEYIQQLENHVTWCQTIGTELVLKKRELEAEIKRLHEEQHKLLFT